MQSLYQIPKDILISILYFLPMKELIEDRRVCKLFHQAIQDVEKCLLKESDRVDFKELYWTRRILEVEREISDCQEQKSLKEKLMENLKLESEARKKHEKISTKIANKLWGKTLKKEKDSQNRILVNELFDLVNQDNLLNIKRDKLKKKQAMRQQEYQVEYAKSLFYSLIGGKEIYDNIPTVTHDPSQRLTPDLLSYPIMRSPSSYANQLYLKNQIKEHEIEIIIVSHYINYINKALFVFKYDPSTNKEVDRRLIEGNISVEAYSELKKLIEEKFKIILQKRL